MADGGLVAPSTPAPDVVAAAARRMRREGMQVDWKSADEVAEDIMKGEATYQLIVDLWSRMGELEDKVVELQAKLQANSKPAATGSVQIEPARRWRTGYR
jgi:hypothetical protein